MTKNKIEFERFIYNNEKKETKSDKLIKKLFEMFVEPKENTNHLEELIDTKLNFSNYKNFPETN
jgi:hypothetical protein